MKSKIENITITIKAFEGELSLILLLRSLRINFNLHSYSLPIVIVDDSYNNSSKKILKEFKDLIIDYYTPKEINIGISAGRKIAFSRVKTDYFIVTDQDIVFPASLDFRDWRDLLIEKDLDILTTSYVQAGITKIFSIPSFSSLKNIVKFFFNMGKKWKLSFKCKDFIYKTYNQNKIKYPSLHILTNSGFFKLQKDMFTYWIDLKTRIDLEDQIIPIDYGRNMFLAKKNSIKESFWEEEVKNGYEHVAFYLNTYKNGLKIAQTDQFYVYHVQIQTQFYAQYRNEPSTFYYIKFLEVNRLKMLLRLEFYKHGIFYIFLSQDKDLITSYLKQNFSNQEDLLKEFDIYRNEFNYYELFLSEPSRDVDVNSLREISRE